MTKRYRLDDEDADEKPHKARNAGLRIEELEPALRINENALDEALLQQPDLFWRVSKELALVTSRRDAAKKELEQVMAEIDTEIRRKSSKSGEKTTEGAIKAKTATNQRVVDASEVLTGLNLKVGMLSALKEAFQQRSYMLKELVSLHMANYFGTDGAAKRQTDYEETRARLRAARRETDRGRD